MSSTEENNTSINNKTSFENLSKGFYKRSGTTDLGRNYEHFYLIHLILKLVSDGNVEDFYLSSNDKDFGAFDDAVVEIKYKSKKEVDRYALQLKHTNNKVVHPSHLTSSTGNYSIEKYFKEKPKEQDCKLILFTNSKSGQLKDASITITLDGSVVNTNIVQDLIKNDVLNTTEAISKDGPQEKCYRLEDKENNIDFLKKFYLYTDEADVKSLRESNLNTFTTTYGGNQDGFVNLEKFIETWSLKEGRKTKLGKDLMTNVVALFVCSPHIRELNFWQDSLITAKEQIIKDVISKFNITELNAESVQKITNFWQDAHKECNIDDVKEIIIQYQLTSKKVTTIQELNNQDKETNILLWILGKCPLVLLQSPETDKAIKLCAGKKFIIVRSSDVSNVYEQGNEIFTNLSDLREKPEYNDILQKFEYSLEEQKPAALESLITLNRDLDRLIKSDHLISMLENPLRIGNDKVNLPECHIFRNLSKTVIDTQFLHKTENCCIFINNANRKELGKRFRKQVSETDRILALNNHVKLFLHSQQFSDDEIEKLSEDKPFHHFNYIDQFCLEWLKSSSDTEQLSNFRTDHKYDYSVHESQLLNDENKVNIVCANPGMGKTTLAISLKLSSSSLVWTKIINAKNCIKMENATLENFLNVKEEQSLLEKEVFETMKKAKKMRLIWDGLDETSSSNLQKLLKIIGNIKKEEKDVTQWLTSRVNLKDSLEDILEVFSRDIREFDEEQQKFYIKERLQLSDDSIGSVYKKIKSGVLFLSNSILGIPLQIYMLTELFKSNLDNYLKRLDKPFGFTTLDLYESFVEEKFLVYQKEKRNMDLNISRNKSYYEAEKKEIVAKYQEVAHGAYFNTSATLYNLVCCSFDKKSPVKFFLDDIKSGGDPIGFITTVNDEGPQFAHNSYGEYFAALFLFENQKTKAKNSNFISDSQYNNIRFFLDLMLCKDSKCHIAVLYGNHNLLLMCPQKKDKNELILEEEEEDWFKTDALNRDALELACAWSRDHPVISPKTFKPVASTAKPLHYSKISKYFTNIQNSLHRCVKHLLMFLPFLIPLYNIIHHRFDDELLPTVVFHVLQFDHGFIFDCSENISWLKNLHTKLNPKDLMSLIIRNNSTTCFQILIEKQSYADVLLRNFDYRLDISGDQLYKYFCLLNETVNKGASTQVSSKVKTQNDIRILLKKCIQVNSADSNGKFLVHHVCESGDQKTLKLLEEEGADLEAKDKDGLLPIHYACKKGNYDVVKFLIDKGVEINQPDHEGKAPLNYAQEQGNRYIVELLLGKSEL